MKCDDDEEADSDECFDSVFRVSACVVLRVCASSTMLTRQEGRVAIDSSVEGKSTTYSRSIESRTERSGRVIANCSEIFQATTWWSGE
jgi:hypothetical protein